MLDEEKLKKSKEFYYDVVLTCHDNRLRYALGSVLFIIEHFLGERNKNYELIISLKTTFNKLLNRLLLNQSSLNLEDAKYVDDYHCEMGEITLFFVHLDNQLHLKTTRKHRRILLIRETDCIVNALSVVMDDLMFIKTGHKVRDSFTPFPTPFVCI
jgi:hypothetical protein